MRTGKVKIWMQLLGTVALALVMVWTGVIIWQGHVNRELAIQQATDYSHSMHNATMAGLTGMMVTGTVSERHVFLDQIKQLGTIRDVRVLRGEPVKVAFGPGTSQDDSQPDAIESQVFQTGEARFQVEADQHGEYLRAVRPALALTDSLGKNCLTCHQVPERSVLGVVSMKVSLDKVNAEQAAQRWQSILLALVTAIPVLGLIYPFIRRVVTHPLEYGVQTARAIAAGDLTHQIDVTSNNEIGALQRALQDMRSSLARTVGQVRSGTEAIYGASGDIARGNSDLSARTEQQADSLERTTLSMRQLTAGVNQNAANAHNASDLAASASGVAERAGGVVSEVVSTMDAINASSRRIADITSVIDGIAFQTNILALNAAVEAARAGEQGRGFAVVASEVRSLAQRSAAAAQEIKALIGDSVGKIDAGSALVHQAGATMTEVVESIRNVSVIVSEIAQASAEQTQGIERVNTAIDEMNDVTQQNAALVEQAAAAAQSLQDQAGNLEKLVQTFTLPVGH
ncbi:MAG TPA: methyl-accepting chemotaxis protein [Burkholderiaceae bacterium]|nr:methyl-accepting chemotaxis protein [Burkholderiaceae bacterium]